MRMKRTSQMSIYEIFAKHKIGDELIKISSWLDAHTEVLDWVEADIQRKDLNSTGRCGMTIESILRSGFLLRYWQWTYEELAFHLMDSEINYGFARLPRGLYPKVSALQGVISLIRAETWECINQLLIKGALDAKIECAKASAHRQHGDGQSDSCAVGQHSSGRCCSDYGSDDERSAATLPGIELYQPSACGEEPGDCDPKLQGCFDTASAL